MTCRHCVRTVSGRLRDVAGVETVAANATEGSVVLRGVMGAADVMSALAECGFPGRVVT
jgi:copper chaperone CopZ